MDAQLPPDDANVVVRGGQERNSATKQELVAVKAELQDDISGVNRDLTGHIVETQRQMRVLYEDLVARITTLGESRLSGS